MMKGVNRWLTADPPSSFAAKMKALVLAIPFGLLMGLPSLMEGCDSSDQIDPMPNGTVQADPLSSSSHPREYTICCPFQRFIFLNFTVDGGSCWGHAVVAAVQYGYNPNEMEYYVEACWNTMHQEWQAIVTQGTMGIPFMCKASGTLYWRPVYIICGELVWGEIRSYPIPRGEICVEPDWYGCDN
jgi:hypothetical protein